MQSTDINNIEDLIKRKTELQISVYKKEDRIIKAFEDAKHKIEDTFTISNIAMMATKKLFGCVSTYITSPRMLFKLGSGLFSKSRKRR